MGSGLFVQVFWKVEGCDSRSNVGSDILTVQVGCGGGGVGVGVEVEVKVVSVVAGTCGCQKGIYWSSETAERKGTPSAFLYILVPVNAATLQEAQGQVARNLSRSIE